MPLRAALPPKDGDAGHGRGRPRQRRGSGWSYRNPWGSGPGRAPPAHGAGCELGGKFSTPAHLHGQGDQENPSSSSPALPTLALGEGGRTTGATRSETSPRSTLTGR